MKKLITVLALTLVAQPVAAQARFPGNVPTPPKTWITVAGVTYTTVSGVIDPTSNSRWTFDDTGFGGGAGIQREFGQGLLVGVEGTLARAKAQRTGIDTDEVYPQTNASIGTGMVTGRFAYGGGGSVGVYLTGGLG